MVYRGSYTERIEALVLVKQDIASAVMKMSSLIHCLPRQHLLLLRYIPRKGCSALNFSNAQGESRVCSRDSSGREQKTQSFVVPSILQHLSDHSNFSLRNLQRAQRQSLNTRNSKPSYYLSYIAAYRVLTLPLAL